MFKQLTSIFLLSSALLTAGLVDPPPVEPGLPVSFDTEPRTWAVINGEYVYTFEASNEDLDEAGYQIQQKPDWLVHTGNELRGTPPTADIGLAPRVIINAYNLIDIVPIVSDTQDFTINIGELVGPVATPKGGGSASMTMPALARAGGDVMSITNVTNAINFPIFWGLGTEGWGMAMDYTGPDGSSGDDFEVPGSFVFDAAEIGQWQSVSSDLEAGLGVWKGTTNRPASVGGAAVDVYLQAEALELLPAGPLPMLDGAIVGVDSKVGALVQVPSFGAMNVNLRLNALGFHPSGTPALDWFNALSPKAPTDRTITSVTHGFYWVNSAPRFTANPGMAVDQGAAVVFTKTLLNAVDTEHLDSEIRFVIGDGGADGAEGVDIPGPSVSGTPQYGDVQVLNDPVGNPTVWTTLVSGDSFTLKQIEDGHVRYLNDDSYSTGDGFNFEILDAENAKARDGEHTVYRARIYISLVNHEPVANDQSEDVGLGATFTGTLDWSDSDVGEIPQSFTVSSLVSTTPIGTFSITNSATGAFSFVSNGSVGNTEILWKVNDGGLEDTATLTIDVSNQSPSITSFEDPLSGSNDGDIVGTLTVEDPDLPAQAITLNLISGPSKGVVKFNGQQITYTPNEGRFGNDSFVITASDPLGGVSAQETIYLSIQPSELGDEALFVGGSNEEDGATLQRLNPITGDVYTLLTDFGEQIRGLAWIPSERKLLLNLNVGEGGGEAPANALVKVDPLTGFIDIPGDIVTMDGLLAFPIGLSMDGPDHVLVANGPGGVVRVNLLTGVQEQLDLGLLPGSFITSAVANGPDAIWLTNVVEPETFDDGTLLLASRINNFAYSPFNFIQSGDPSGDPTGLYIKDGSLVVARSGGIVQSLPLEELPPYLVEAYSYTSSELQVPLSITPFEDGCVIADPFVGGDLYFQPFITSFDLVIGEPEVALDPEVLPLDFPDLMTSSFAVLSVQDSPSIGVEVGEASVANTGTIDFGSVAVDSDSGDISFTVTNTGSGELIVSTPTITGTHASDFTLIADPATTLVGGESSTMTIRFDPSASDDRDAVVTIPSSDVAQPSFTINLTGLGNSPPEFSGLNVSSIMNGIVVVTEGLVLANTVDVDGDTFSLTEVAAVSNRGASVVSYTTAFVYHSINGFAGTDYFDVTLTDEHGDTTVGRVIITIGSVADTIEFNTIDIAVNESDEPELSFVGVPSTQYLLQRSIDLLNWYPIALLQSDEIGDVFFLDTNPPYPKAFYRMSEPGEEERPRF